MPKTILITGGSRGIGAAIAGRFAEAGWQVLLTARSEGRLFATVDALRSAHPAATVEGAAFDLAIKGDCGACAEWALRFSESPDVLVNNAGAFVPGNVGDEPDGALEETMATNLYSAYHLTRGLLPAMRARGSGHIFNMASIAGQIAYPGGGAYSISKFALIGFSQNLRRELLPTGIKVTTVIPGAVYTDSWAGSGVSPDRIMQADDVAAAVWCATQLSPQAVMEEIVLRPQQGDL